MGPVSLVTGPKYDDVPLMKMRPALHFSQIIDAPTAVVWRLITDTHAWPRCGPTVRAVDCAERNIRAGSTGRVQTPFGIWLPFAIERFEPERYWDWRVGGVAATGHWVKPRGPEQCELAFTVPSWGAGYGIVCRAALKRIERLLARADQTV